MTKVRPVTLVITDTGPLLSLAVIDRLDLLQSFGRPVYVTDVVKYECLRYPARAGVDRLQKWLEIDGGNQRRIVETPLGSAYLKARELEESGHVNATEHIGEWSMTWTMQNLTSFIRDLHLPSGDHVALLLVDENSYAKGLPPHEDLPPNTHFLSTRAFFLSLAKLGIIKNANDLREEIKNSGRPRVTKAIFDIPFKSQAGRSDYLEGMKDTLEKAGKNNEDDDPGTSFS